uniref:Uncharacterized protein n=1 Tax=Anopheles funestus TaxID=62324 RepID=A0A182RQ65_ANOFN
MKMVLVQILLTIIVLRYTKAAQCVSSDNKFTSEELNKTVDEGWNCEKVPDQCLIFTTVNYRVPDKEFSINFHCNVPPIRNAHSNKVFRTVTSYRMGGRALKELIVANCTGIDFNASVLANVDLIDMQNSMVRNIASIFDPLPVKLRVINFLSVSSQENSKLTLQSPAEGESAAQHIAMVECLLNSIAVKNMPTLVSLNLSKNSLSASSVELVDLPALVTLVLSHNSFDTVSQTLLQFESSLDTIDLSHNQISFLHPKAFDAVHSLRMVNLSFNLLLNMESFQPQPRLDRIEIDANPWNCSWLNQCLLLNPTLFNIFRYNKRFDVLSVWGLPCVLHIAVTDSNESPSVHQTKSEQFISYPRGKIFPLGNKTTLAQPRFTLANPLKAIISISVGVLVSNVIILLYNRYRNILHEPFYRYLAKSLGDALTEKSTSFWYEVPVSDAADAIPLNNIYEEISEALPRRDIYDALNFRDVPDEQQQLDDNTSG